MRALRIAFVLTLASMYSAPDARANGRFPKAQAIVTPPPSAADAGGGAPVGGDGSTLYLRATFGVLVSHDGGKSFAWLCEQALGFSSTWDPPIAVTQGGRLWVALADGLRSTVDGCAVRDERALAGELVADLTTDATGARLFAITSTPSKPAYVWRITGDRAERLGAGVKGFRFDTIEVAPSRATRLYLTAVPEGKGGSALFRSDDGGATLTALAPKLPRAGRLFVSAIDANDPNRLYVRQLSEAGSDVLVSGDGGATFTSVLHFAGAMFGFARADDGTLYAGSGDPKEGIWRSRDRGEHWEAAAHASVFCLHARGDRLYVCSNPYTPHGYAVAVSTDRGATLTPLATFDDVRGAVACDAGEGARCAAAWPETRAAIASSAQVPTIAPLSEDAAIVPVDAATAPPAAKAARHSACSCDVVGGDRASSRSVATLALALLLLAARRAGSRTVQTESAAHHPRARRR